MNSPSLTLIFFLSCMSSVVTVSLCLHVNLSFLIILRPIVHSANRRCSLLSNEIKDPADLISVSSDTQTLSHPPQNLMPLISFQELEFDLAHTSVKLRQADLMSQQWLE